MEGEQVGGLQGNSAGALLQDTAGTLNQQTEIENPNADEEGNELQNKPIRFLPSTIEEYFRTIFIPDRETTIIIMDTLRDTHEAFGEVMENLNVEKINAKMTGPDIVIKTEESARIAHMNGILKKLTIRCQKMLDFQLHSFLNDMVFYSNEMNLETVEKVLQALTQHFISRRIIKRFGNIIKSYMKTITLFNHILEKAKLKGRKEGQHSTEDILPPPESIQDLLTPSDHNIAVISTWLLNCTEKYLLPTLKKAGVLSENHAIGRDSDEPYSCPDAPEALREHMAILVELLTDSEDLPNPNVIPISDPNEFLAEVEGLKFDCMSLQRPITDIWFASSNAVTQLENDSMSMSGEQNVEVFHRYNETIKYYTTSMELIHKTTETYRRHLQFIVKYFLKLCDLEGMEEKLATILGDFLYMMSFLRLHVELIENDAKRLDDLKSKFLTED